MFRHFVTSLVAESPNGEGTMSEAIRADGVRVVYPDGTKAVDGVDLHVPKGEFFGFLGPNGAGKTTTIRTLVTLLRPTDGSVTVNGYDVGDDPKSVRRSVGYMAQETGIDEELTARENVEYMAAAYGISKDERAERRRRTPRPRGPVRRGRQVGEDVLRRDEETTRRRYRVGPPPPGRLPRRTDRGAGPQGAKPTLGLLPRDKPRGNHRVPDDPVLWRRPTNSVTAFHSSRTVKSR